ncbi:MAG: translocase [Nitrosopumilaceae archaeon]|nr:translocase [Nitrosopumilaceae archaeon]NIP09870.1 translocase [Nitrosopumilaceae archaeon]NIS94641.1 translocase [Nitrosopumilaceae archaeon]
MFLANISNFIAGQEWIFIIIIVAVLIFGAKKIPELAKTFGKAKGEFEKGKIEGEKELKDFKEKASDVNKESKSD